MRTPSNYAVRGAWLLSSASFATCLCVLPQCGGGSTSINLTDASGRDVDRPEEDDASTARDRDAASVDAGPDVRPNPDANDARGDDGAMGSDARADAGTDASGPAGTAVLQVAAGTAHTCAILKASGTVKCWGSGQYGQLGLGDTNHRGDVPGEMGGALPAVDLGVGRTAKQICAGGTHSCVIVDDDSVRCWGTSNAGQLGLGNTDPHGTASGQMGSALPQVALGTGRTARAITCGGAHTCALLDDHTVKCWGAGGSGQTGLGTIANRGDGAGEMGDALSFVNLGTGRTAKGVAAGANHTCAVLDNDDVKCWGANSDGQLGISSNGQDVGGSPSQMGDALPAVNLGAGNHAKAVSAGYYHTCALLTSGAVKCWGSKLYGMLGLGDTVSTSLGNGPAVQLGTGLSATMLHVGDKSACALVSPLAKVKCWGTTGGYHLGGLVGLSRGDEASEMGDALPAVELGSGRTVKALGEARANHVCAVLDDDTARCWGTNDKGQLGAGDTEARGNGVGSHPIGHGMGDALPVLMLE